MVIQNYMEVEVQQRDTRHGLCKGFSLKVKFNYHQTCRVIFKRPTVRIMESRVKTFHWPLLGHALTRLKKRVD